MSSLLSLPFVSLVTFLVLAWSCLVLGLGSGLCCLVLWCDLLCCLVCSVIYFDCPGSSEVLGIWHFNTITIMRLGTSVLQRYAVFCILVCLSFEKGRSQGLQFVLCLVPVVILFIFLPLHFHLHTLPGVFKEIVSRRIHRSAKTLG